MTIDFALSVLRFFLAFGFSFLVAGCLVMSMADILGHEYGRQK